MAYYPYDHHNITLTFLANMVRLGDKMKMANKLDWRLISSKTCAVEDIYLQEYEYYGFYMKYVDPMS